MPNMKLCVRVSTTTSSVSMAAVFPENFKESISMLDVKNITAQKNEARNELRHAEASASSSLLIQTLARKLYWLVHIHSAEKKIVVQSKINVEGQEEM